ncbi:alpha/beta hydrolase [Ramlibacter henchirensis]|uniref:Alpha/beta hydrolase n=1 Tax=Ramlibacter henchirensis TaxID=204072 RepID=A0A4Z0BQT0_9BURK|nr:alpha/beta hydrolase [Ramlibacter henchirensis]TFZ00760.1 alpha/beta hydrolase [Ramlibacter henchirensis]
MSQAGLLSSFAPGQALDTLRQPLRQLFNAPKVRRTGQGRIYEGDGQPVIVFPRQGTGPESTAPLRRTLEEAGFRPFDWGHGRDEGPRGMGLPRWLRKLEECVIDAFEVTQAPVTLIGWGLSGIYARELAKRANPLVRQVITLGSPFNTAADPHRRCKVVALLDAGPERMPLCMRNSLRQQPPVPCTAIYSKDDGVVRWEQCVERESHETENIELPGVRHEELPAHPRALEVITHRLAQPKDEWRPFEATARLLS